MQRKADGYEDHVDCELRGHYPVGKTTLPASGKHFVLSWTEEICWGPIWQQGYLKNNVASIWKTLCALLD